MAIPLLTKNRINKILILLSFLIIFLLLFIVKIDWNCPFKKIFHIACPGCGITRAIRELMNFNLIKSFEMNILGIPITIIIILSVIFVIKDIIKDENRYVLVVTRLIKKYYILIFAILMVTMILNNINHI